MAVAYQQTIQQAALPLFVADSTDALPPEITCCIDQLNPQLHPDLCDGPLSGRSVSEQILEFLLHTGVWYDNTSHHGLSFLNSRKSPMLKKRLRRDLHRTKEYGSA